MRVTALPMSSYEIHQGTMVSWSRIKIPRPQCHKAMNFMQMVGPVGLEPTTVCFVVDYQFTMHRFCMSIAT